MERVPEFDPTRTNPACFQGLAPRQTAALPTPGSTEFSTELERLTKTASEYDTYAVTTDPRVNRTMIRHFNDRPEEEVLGLLASIGLNPPSVGSGHVVSGLVVTRFGDDLDNPGVLAWDVYGPDDE